MTQVFVDAELVTVDGVEVTVPDAQPGDLVFQFTQDYSPNLLFGEDATVEAPHYDATLNATLPSLTLSALAIPDAKLTVSASFPALTLSATGDYQSYASRPTVGKVASAMQKAVVSRSSPTISFSDGDAAQSVAASEWQVADRASASVLNTIEDAPVRLRTERTARHQDADRLTATNRSARHQDADRAPRLSRRSGYENAVRVGVERSARHQDTWRDRRAWRKSGYQEAARSGHLFDSSHQKADPLDFWRTSWYQDAMKPPVGRQLPPVVPPGEVCYTPNPHLVFAKIADGSSSLLFICDNDTGGEVGPPSLVVVPVRSVYMVLNDVSLRRADGDIYLPTLSMTLKIDSGSWTWGFDASVPAGSLSDLEPSSGGDPVELEVNINGSLYRVLAESLSRERSFGQATIRVSGRGKSAYLDSPYSPILNFNNDIERTAQQLMNDALMLNGVSIGWSVDWQLTDWTVPAGVWSHQGSYISALKQIAEAAGGYLQPHATAQSISVLPKYATAPWDWAGVTPDFELPAALTTREGIDWTEKARYNAVYVSGQQSGVLGHVKRTGTAGDVIAPMVVDPLITHIDAARQRGISILGDTGRQAYVSLRVPVLEETGVITPGKMIRYVDNGVSRIGVVRSTDVSVGFPDVFQSLGVETHA